MNIPNTTTKIKTEILIKNYILVTFSYY